jgi:beta-lactamase class A
MSYLEELMRRGDSPQIAEYAKAAQQAQQQLMQDFMMAQTQGFTGTFDDYVNQTTSSSNQPNYNQPNYSQYGTTPNFVATTPSTLGLIYQMSQFLKDPNTGFMR